MEREQLLKNLMTKLKDGVEIEKTPNFSIFIDKDLNISKGDQKIIQDFLSLCVLSTGLEKDYKCFLTANRKRSRIVTTAVCTFGEKRIKIYCHERSLADVLRSIAHEAFHLRQHELDLVPEQMSKPHHLNPIEWQANIAGGSLVSYFAQKVGRDKIYR
jgi:hypothetical protein